MILEDNEIRDIYSSFIEPVVCGHVRSKLRSQGISDYYNHPEFANAWNNYRKYLEDNNLLQIIEFEW